MTDIATLGLQVDSSKVTAATGELNKFAAAAAPAARGADALAAAGKKAGDAAQDMAAAQRAENAEITKAYGLRQNMTQGQVNVIKNYESMIGKQTLLNAGHAREAAQYAALRSAGASADTAYGQTVKALAGHMYDLEQAQNKTERSAGNLATTLTQRLIIGFLVSQIKGLATEVLNLNTALAKVGDTAGRLNIGTGNFQGLEAAAGAKGIGSEKFLSDMLAFGRAVDEAKTGVGSMAALFRLNGQAIGSVEDSLAKVADLVANSKTELGKFNLLQQAGLPATTEWVRLLEKGGPALRAAVKDAQDFGVAADKDLIEKARRFDDDWNKAWTNFKLYARAATVSAIDGLREAAKAGQGMVAPADSGEVDFLGVPTGKPRIGVNSGSTVPGNPIGDKFVGPLAPEKAAPTRDPEKEAAAISRAQQLLGLYGQTTTALEARRQVELQLAAAGLQGIGIDKKRAETLKQLAEDNNLGITSIRASLDATRTEAEAFGLSTGAATAYATAQNLINAARREGRTLTPENIAAIQREAAAYGDAVQRLDVMRQSSELLSSTLKTFRNELQNGSSAWDSFRKAGASALNSIADKLIDIAAKNLVTAAFGGAGGAGGGLSSLISSFFPVAHTGGIVGDGSLAGRYIHPAHFNDAPRFHTGGIVGGEVPIIAKKGEGVFTPEQMKALGPGGGATVNITQNVVFNNADPGSEGRIRQGMQQMKQEAISESVQAVQRLHNNAPGNYMRGSR